MTSTNSADIIDSGLESRVLYEIRQIINTLISRMCLLQLMMRNNVLAIFSVYSFPFHYLRFVLLLKA